MAGDELVGGGAACGVDEGEAQFGHAEEGGAEAELVLVVGHVLGRGEPHFGRFHGRPLLGQIVVHMQVEPIAPRAARLARAKLEAQGGVGRPCGHEGVEGEGSRGHGRFIYPCGLCLGRFGQVQVGQGDGFHARVFVGGASGGRPWPGRERPQQQAQGHNKKNGFRDGTTHGIRGWGNADWGMRIG